MSERKRLDVPPTWEPVFVYRRDDGRWAVGVDHGKPPRAWTTDLQKAEWSWSPRYQGTYFVWPIMPRVDNLLDVFTEDFASQDFKRERLEVVLAYRQRKTGEVKLA